MPPKARLKPRNVVDTIVIEDSSPEPEEALAGPSRRSARIKANAGNNTNPARSKGKARAIPNQVIEITSDSDLEDPKVQVTGSQRGRITRAMSRQPQAGPSTVSSTTSLKARDKGKGKAKATMPSDRNVTLLSPVLSNTMIPPSPSQQQAPELEQPLFLPASDEENVPPHLHPARQQAGSLAVSSISNGGAGNSNADAGPSGTRGTPGSTSKRPRGNEEEEDEAGPSKSKIKRPRISLEDFTFDSDDSESHPRSQTRRGHARPKEPGRSTPPALKAPGYRHLDRDVIDELNRAREDAERARELENVHRREREREDAERIARESDRARRLEEQAQQDRQQVEERRMLQRETVRRAEEQELRILARQQEQERERFEAFQERERERQRVIREFGEGAMLWGDPYGDDEPDYDEEMKVWAGIQEPAEEGIAILEDAPVLHQADAVAATEANDANPNVARPLQAEGSVRDLTGPTTAVLEVIPNIEPDYLAALISTHLPTYGDGVVEFVMNYLFENPDYPKVEKGKGKAKAKAGDGGDKEKGKVVKRTPEEIIQMIIESYSNSANSPFTNDVTSNTNNKAYFDLSLQQLSAVDFPYIPKPVVQRFLQEAVIQPGGGGSAYVRTWIYLSILDGRLTGEVGNGKTFVHSSMLTVPAPQDRGTTEELPYTRKSNPTPATTGKGKKRALQDDGFDAEQAWLREREDEIWRRIRRIERTGSLDPSASTSNGDGADTEDEAEGEENNGEPPWLKDGEDAEPFDESDPGLIECGCCFGSYPIDRMVQCPEGHLFCRFCVYTQSKTLLGSRNHYIKCMHVPEGDAGSCDRMFEEATLKNLLGTKLFRLYERVKQQKELEEAKIEGLEECPFCDFAAVVEVPIEVDKLFRCGNEACGVVSCRECKRVEHTPKSCKEMDEDKHLDGRIAIEEAMTKALMRNCPSCKKSFIKESGCNKMTCPNCRQLSCYVCKQKIRGYDHFHQNNPGQPGGSSTNNKCPLWDSVETRHDDDVKKAYEEAVAQIKKDNPDVEIGKDIKVDLPPPPPPGARNGLPVGYIAPEMFLPGAHGGLPRPNYHYIPAPLPQHLQVDPYREQLRRHQERLARAIRNHQADVQRLPAALAKEQMARARLENIRAGLSAFDSGGRPPDRHERARRASEVNAAQQALRLAAIDRAAIETRVHTYSVEQQTANLAVGDTLRRIREVEQGAEEWRRAQEERRREGVHLHHQEMLQDIDRMMLALPNNAMLARARALIVPPRPANPPPLPRPAQPPARDILLDQVRRANERNQEMLEDFQRQREHVLARAAEGRREDNDEMGRAALPRMMEARDIVEPRRRPRPPPPRAGAKRKRTK